MKIHNSSDEDISGNARKAIEEYPRLHASTDFNRRVLDAMESHKTLSVLDNSFLRSLGSSLRESSIKTFRHCNFRRGHKLDWLYVGFSCSL